MKKKSLYKSFKDFKILFVYPNIQMCEMMPYSIGLLTAYLRKEGFTVDLFDTTFYVDKLNDNYEAFHDYVQEFDWKEKGRIFKSNIVKDFHKKIEEFDPDLISISVVENTYPTARKMIKSLPDSMKKIPIMWGGVFATFAPHLILRDNIGDYVCRGEGENSLIELCKRFCKGEPTYNIPNFWVRHNGSITKNKMSLLADLESAPLPDYSLFPEHAINRAMQGKIRRTIGLETQRGCTFSCAYCNSPSQVSLHKSEVGEMFARKKSIKKVREELEFLHKRYNLELIYFLDDTFLALSERRFDELSEMYMDFKIPFWMNTRCETMTEKRAQKLEDMNMLRMSFGIEHGNEEYRRTILKRPLTNERMLSAFRMVSGKKYVTNGNCIIGMPEENRDLIFDSIEFTRQLPSDMERTGAFIFAPYHGTPLRDLAIKKGYIKDADSICDITKPEDSMLDQPQLSKKELIGLARTFGLYQMLPKSEWKWIKKAEAETNEAIKLRLELKKNYHEKTSSDLGLSKPDTIDA